MQDNNNQENNCNNSATVQLPIPQSALQTSNIKDNQQSISLSSQFNATDVNINWGQNIEKNQVLYNSKTTKQK